MRRWYWLVLVSLILAACGPAQGSVPFYELVADPSRYNQQEVTVLGFYYQKEGEQLLVIGVRTDDGFQNPVPLGDPLWVEGMPQEVLDRLNMASGAVYGLRLLQALGYAPQLASCIRCGEQLRAEWAGFSAALGGAVCQRCAAVEQGWQRLSAGALRTARICAQATPGLLPRVRLTRAIGAELAAAMRSYIEYHLGRRMRSASFLDALPALRRDRAAPLAAPGAASATSDD